MRLTFEFRSLLVAGAVVCSYGVALGGDGPHPSPATVPTPAGKGSPGQAPADGTLVLDGRGYVRQYTEFGLMRISGEALRAEGDRLFGNRLGRVEANVKRYLKGLNYDWTKTDWRDVSTYVFSGTQAGSDYAALVLIPTIAPPPDWAKPEFDDSAFDRIRLGMLSMDSIGELCRQNSAQHRRGLYIRTYLEVPDPGKATDLTLKAVYRGGARVLVNGREIARRDLPEGIITGDTFASDYPAEAYIAAKDERPQKGGWGGYDFVGDLRGPFDLAPAAEGQNPAEYRSSYGYTTVNRRGWERLMRLRDRVLGPVAIPGNLLRKGANVLAIELRASRVHPIILPLARLGELSEEASARAWGGGYACSPRWDHVRLVDLELRSPSQAAPTCLRRPEGMRVWVEDMHTRLTVRDFSPPGWPTGTVSFVGAPNGVFSAQLGVSSGRELSGLKATCSDLAGDKGGKIPAAAITVQHLVGHGLDELPALGTGRCSPQEASDWRGNPLVLTTLYRYSDGVNLWGVPLPRDGDAAMKVKSAYLRALKFFDHLSPRPAQVVPSNSCQPIWLSLKVPQDAPPGVYRGTVTVGADGQAPVAVPLEAEVIGWRVPDPRDFQMIVQAEQSPFGIAKHYKAELWSQGHFQLMESSFRQLGRVGSRWLFVPVLLNSELGNREAGMIRWMRKADSSAASPGPAPGALTFDYSVLDRYLALAQKCEGRPVGVCFLVMHGCAASSNLVKVFDEGTGKDEQLEVGPAQGAVRRPLWRAFGASLYEHMKSLGLADVMYWGQAFDDTPDKSLISLLAEVAPEVYWAAAGHGRAPDSTFRVAARAYGVDLLPESLHGWKNPYVHLLMPRTGGSVICTEGISTPFTWRVMCDRAIWSGFNGIGRAGADYFDAVWFEGFKGGQWNMAGRAAVQTLWPGKDQVESSARNEAMLEGIQEAEARIYLEQALDRKVLPEDLAREVDTVLSDHFRGTLHISAAGIDFETMDLTADWQGRSRRLYAAAAKVAARLGLDVDKTALGQSTLAVTAYGEKATLSGAKVSVPALGKTRLALRLRNWSDQPRTWRAASADNWIVPEKPEGSVRGQQELGIVLDGSALKPGQEVTGTVTITDVVAGTAYPVRISARVDKAMGLRLRQEIDFITGGGSGAESPKTIHIETEPVFNVAVGGSQMREYPLVSRAAAKQTWRLESDCDWLTAEPASGEIAPGATTMVKLVARPQDKEGAFHEPTLTLTAAGGAVKEEYRIKTYVIAPYQCLAVPAGPAVYLNDLDQKKFLKEHVDAGFGKGDKDRKRPRPWVFSDPPLPYYHRFHRAESPPEGMKREEYAASPYMMGGKTFRRGLWVSPNHHTVYNVEGAGFAAFAAEVGFHDRLKASPATAGAVVSFEVYVDGKLRAHSGLMTFTDGPRLLVVDNLQNAKEIKLTTRRDDLVNDWYTVVTWGDPRFIKVK